ncbi:hypothetical protein [Faecalibacterium sp.]|uniref:hypothetical protein n=1 Tax=Faecalibacterium sp. TaxID=1971605 RepID=UPI00399BFD2E
MTTEKKNVFCKFFTGILFRRFGEALPCFCGCKKHPQRLISAAGAHFFKLSRS